MMSKVNQKRIEAEFENDSRAFRSMSSGNSNARKRVPSDRRRHKTSTKTRQNGPGLLHNMFQYVSREVQSFVASASGEVADEDDFTSEEESYSSEEDISTEREGTSYLEHRRLDSQVPRNVSSRAIPSDEHIEARHEPSELPITTHLEGVSARSLECPPDALRLQHSMPILSHQMPNLMPGSLYPRSPSPEPSTSKHVHFTPPSHRQHNPSKSRKTATKPTPTPASVALPRSRTNSLSSEGEDVRMRDSRQSPKSAVYPSLPVQGSPARTVNDNTQSRSKPSGSMRPPSPRTKIARPGPSSQHDPSASLGSSWRDRSLDRGRSQSVDSVSNLRGPPSTILASSEEPQVVPSLKGKERAVFDDSIDISDGSERSSDRIRIQLLEEEVQRLRAELSKRPDPSDQRNTGYPVSPAPPPPPPPPPPSFNNSRSSWLPQTREHIPSPAETDALYSVARAHLKSHGQPQEKPINPMTSSKRSNLRPTVPADHMQAFLSELKTVRLRKTRSNSDIGPDRSFQVPTKSKPEETSFLSNRTWSAGDESMVSSRKRNYQDVFGQEGIVNGAKRRLRDTASQDSDIPLGVPNGTGAVKTLWQAAKRAQASVPSTSTTIVPADMRQSMTTPSLCSDNDGDRDEEAIPKTPPELPRAASPSPELPQARPSYGKVAALPKACAKTKPYASVRDEDDIFSRRPPSSPLDNTQGPRKPKPPARARVPSNPSAKARQKAKDQEKMDDPLLLSATDDGVHNEVASLDKRRTLDVEILNAAEAELDTLTGVGSRPRGRGFLAHGGAGGKAIFLGEGYVEGYVEVETREPPKATRRRAAKR